MRGVAVLEPGPPSKREPSWIPYDRAPVWRRHDDYFQTRGLDAWREGDIPHRGTNNYTFAADHARLFVELVLAREAEGLLAPHEPIDVLELGSGLGDFARRFLLALEVDGGDRGRAVLERTRYILSDVSRRSLDEAARRPGVARWIREGRLVPAVHDARAPGVPCDLAGAPLRVAPLLCVANYVCCVLPHKAFRRSAGDWRELHVVVDDPSLSRWTAQLGSLRAEDVAWLQAVGAHQWLPVRLEQVFRGEHGYLAHAALLESLFPALPEAEIAYPYAFVDLLESLGVVTRPGGMLLISDFDAHDSFSVGDPVHAPTMYGDSLNHAVHFTVLAAMARRKGHTLLDSGPDSVTRTVASSLGAKLPVEVETAFAEAFVHRNRSQDRLDFERAGRSLCEHGDIDRGLRFFRRALTLDPFDPALHLAAAEACLAAHRSAEARAHLDRGQQLDTESEHDFQPLLDRLIAPPTMPGAAPALSDQETERSTP